MPKFGHLCSKTESRMLVENSRFPQFRNVGSFWVVLQLLGVVLAGFGWSSLVLVDFGSFWLVPGFSKYACTRCMYQILPVKK